MIKALATLLLITSFVGLSACNTSGGRNTYAGSYVGASLLQSANSEQNQARSDTIAITITKNGEVLLNGISDNSVDDHCIDEVPVYLEGNLFSYTDWYFCSISGAGDCEFKITGSGSVKDNILTYDSSGTAKCSGILSNFTGNFTGTKSTIP